MKIGIILLASAVGFLTAWADDERVTVRVLPQAVATNNGAFRLGFQTGFLEGPGNPLRAECLTEANLEAGGRATAKRVTDPNTGFTYFEVANEEDCPRGVTLTSAVLRKGVGHTVRVRCRRIKGSSQLRFAFAPVGGDGKDVIEKSVSVKGDGFVDKSFTVTPRVDDAFRCTFQLSAGSEMALAGFSLVPDDAEAGWDSQSLEALRAIGPGVLRWPVQRGVGFYNWYDGVGPLGLRRAVSPMARPEDGHAFGTVEFIGFCRLVGAQPLLRVTVFQPGRTDVPDLEAGIRLAADWVAYCNATNGHPMAALRARHGHAAALDVKRWELTTAEVGVPDAAVCRAYAAAMKAEDAEIEVGVAREALAVVHDRYVAQVMRRLAEKDEVERVYYGKWYATLGMACAALGQLRLGAGGDLCTSLSPEQVLYRVPYAKYMLTEEGLLMALFNRFPAKTPLVTEGIHQKADEPLQVHAAWTEDLSALVVFVYNSGPEARTVRLDLTELRRHFGFWVSEQMAADITTRRAAQTLPVYRKQRAGAALTQVVLCEAPPASFTRIVVKE